MDESKKFRNKYKVSNNEKAQIEKNRDIDYTFSSIYPSEEIMQKAKGITGKEKASDINYTFSSIFPSEEIKKKAMREIHNEER